MKFCRLALCCVLFIAACMPAHSQTGIRANIPFDFKVGNQLFPSGEYYVAPGFNGNDAAWLITNHQGKTAVFVTTSVSSPVVEHRCSLFFRRFSGEYTLVQFWQAGHDGRDVIRPKINRLMIAQSEVVQIPAQR